MSEQTILMFASAAWMIGLVATIRTENLRSAIAFKAVPLLLAIGLALFALARVKGWPI